MKRLLALGFFVFSFVFQSLSHARTQILAFVDPEVSRQGENIMFTIRIEVDERVAIDSPQLGDMSQWEILNAYNSQGMKTSFINGTLSSKIHKEFVYILKPLKSGTIKIPAAQINVNGKNYTTEEINVKVEKVASGRSNQAPPPSPRKRPGFPTLDPEDDFDNLLQGILGRPLRPMPQDDLEDPMPSLPSEDLSDLNVPELESFFVRAIPSKTTVYKGELIVLSYVLFQREMALSNFEFSKFPSFKGFLKEELKTITTMDPRPVILNGRSYLKTELIRFALFPLKEGELSIDPLQFKASMSPSAQSMLNQLMGGQARDPLPQVKSSQALKIKVLALPPPPGDSSFKGAVGQFTLELKGPTGKIHQDQPFTVNLNIRGRGNLKSIEAPFIPLPENVEAYDIKPNYEFREDATGFKNFEYLYLPRKKGALVFPPQKWSYFNPETKSYVTLETPSLNLDVLDPLAPGQSEEIKIKEKTLSPLVLKSTQLWYKSFDIWKNSPLLHPVFLSAQGLSFVMLGLMFFFRSRHEKLNERLKKAPWIKTEQTILSQSKYPAFELSELIDQWLRERLNSLLSEAHIAEIHKESPHSEFIRALEKLDPERILKKQREELKDYWSELDSYRFSIQKNQNELSSKTELKKAQELVEKFILKSENMTRS